MFFSKFLAKAFPSAIKSKSYGFENRFGNPIYGCIFDCRFVATFAALTKNTRFKFLDGSLDKFIFRIILSKYGF